MAGFEPHPAGNRRALAFAADAYEATGAIEDHIRVLTTLASIDPTNRRVRLALVRALSKAGHPAIALVDTLVSEDPRDGEAVHLQLLVHLAAKDFDGALDIGDSLVALDTAAATRDFFVRMIAAADAANNPQRAAQLATRAVAKFSTDDELAILEVQYLRRAGAPRKALDAVLRLVARNPRTPNAWSQKTRIEAELGSVADTVISSLTQSMTAGDDRGTVAAYARTLGRTTATASVATPGPDGFRTAVRYYKFAESVQANDTTEVLLGGASLTLSQRLAVEAGSSKKCDLARESQSALTDAQMNFAKAEPTFMVSAQTRQALQQTATCIDQVNKVACR